MKSFQIVEIHKFENYVEVNEEIIFPLASARTLTGVAI